MTDFIEVAPENIQKELDKLEAAQEENNQQRASLFNLVVFAQQGDKLGYFHSIVDQITTQFPCRILFIVENPNLKTKKIKTGIAAKVLDSSQGKSIICDQIQIEFNACSLDQVYLLTLPYFIPDLPVYLLWGRDPTEENPLFAQFKKIAHRLIFESECSNNLQNFATRMLSQILSHGFDVADLNWIRSEGFRGIIKSIFNNDERLQELFNAHEITIHFLGSESKYFCHNHFQVHYFHAWLAAQLHLTPESYSKEDEKSVIVYKRGEHILKVELMEDSHAEHVEPGSITYLEIKSQTNKVFICRQMPKEQMIQIEILDAQKPSEAYNTLVIQPKWETSLSREICYHETSTHYCNMLNILSQIKGLV